jgi:GxxExxY protein
MINHRATKDTELDALNPLSSEIIAAAIEVHRTLGPGLLESIYLPALCIELEERSVRFVRQARVPAYYKGRSLGDYRVDLIVDDKIVVEVKSVAAVLPVFESQLITYLRLTRKRLGLILNFNAPLLKDGIVRRAL